MQKILVVRYGTIGDTIFASAFYRELRAAFPDAQIDILVDKVAKSVMKNCPYVNNMIDICGKYKKIFHYINIFRKYDTVYFLKNDSFFSQTAFLSGIKNRIGFDVRRNFALTKKTPYDNKKHEIDYYLDLLKINDVRINNDKTEVWLDANDTEKMSNLLNTYNNKKVLIQAYSRFSQKNWIDEYWIKIIEYLSDRNYQVFFVGGNEDKDKYANIENNITYKIKPINMCGKLSINETMAFVSKMDFVFGIDSGVIHMAAALDIPSVLLNGPTSIVRWKPRSEKCIVLSENFECSPCCFASSRNKKCLNKESECMKALSPDKVTDVLKTFS